MAQTAAEDNVYEVQTRMRQTMEETRDRFAKTSRFLLRRLESLVQDHGAQDDQKRLRLQSGIETSKQCLDLCNLASEMSRQKIYKVGEAVADGNSDQVVVNTLADLFDIGKAVSTDHSSQLLGSMTAECLCHLADRRYASRLGAVQGNPGHAGGTMNLQSTSSGAEKERLPVRSVDQEQESRPRPNEASPNQIMKRKPGDDLAR